MSQHEILVVDDELGIRELLSEILTDEGYIVEIAEDAKQASLYRQKRQPSMVLLDIWMPNCDGLTLLKEWGAQGLLTMPVVMMSGHGSLEQAKEAERLGAVGFMEKPITLQKLLDTVEHTLKKAQPAQALLDVSQVGCEQTHMDVRKHLQERFHDRLPFFLSGDENSIESILNVVRSTIATWVEVTAPGDLINQPNRLFQQAAGGVLYCPHIERYTAMQRKGFYFVWQQAVKQNIWVIASTTWPDILWQKRIDSHTEEWRSLTKHRLQLPSLRQQLQLAPDVVLERVQRRVCPDVPSFNYHPSAIQRLQAHSWWGGDLELETLIMRLAALNINSEVTLELVEQVLAPDESSDKEPPSIEFAQGDIVTSPSVYAEWFGLSLRQARECFERTYFEYLLHRTTLGMSQIAERSGLERTHLYRKLKQLGISREH